MEYTSYSTHSTCQGYSNTVAINIFFWGGGGYNHIFAQLFFFNSSSTPKTTEKCQLQHPQTLLNTISSVYTESQKDSTICYNR